MLRFLTAGESHGQALVAILEGMPANLAWISTPSPRSFAAARRGTDAGDAC
jgi:chorismate synthase